MAASYQHVTRDTRCQISVLKARGYSNGTIAKELGYHRSSIGRELKRNRTLSGYHHVQADSKARSRRTNACRQASKMTPSLNSILKDKLLGGWSPEQISGRLKAEGSLEISFQSIYKWIWADKKSGGALYKQLRHRGKRYNKKPSKTAGRGCIPERVDISERPKVVEDKSRIGDWEGDTIIGAQHKGAIVSYVDRHSKFVLLKKVSRKTSELVTKATIEIMKELVHPVLSITYDNGKEFCGHKTISKTLNTKCYFATPYHSWERGLNEHTNGLVRQYIPKSKYFSEVTDEDVQAIENKLNHRPRKSLNYRTPHEVFFSDLETRGVALQN